MKSIQKSMTLRALQAGLLASALFAAPAFGARLAYEGFDYTEADGTSISGLNGGDFWDEAYPAPSGTVALTPALTTYTGTGAPATIGKAVKFSNNANLGLGRDWADATVPLANGSVYWYSLYVNPSFDGSASGRGTLVPFKSLLNTNGQEGFGVRIDNNSGKPQFKAWHPTQAGGSNIDFAANTGKTYFVLGRVDINTGGNSTNRIWVYEDPSAIPTTEPAVGTAMSTATAVWTGAADSLRTTLSGRAFGSPNPGISYDEIRIATTFAEVFPAVVGIPSFALDPITAVQNQTLTFNWTNIPPGSNPTLNNVPVTIDGAGTGSTTLPAPAINTTYTLNWTGAAAPLTQEFIAIAPFLTISPSSAYLGDTLTLNWRVPVGSTAITLTPNSEGLDLDSLTNALTGAGTTPIPIPAPNAPTTVYTITWTGPGNGATGVSQTFTLLPSFLNVTPDPVAEGVSLAINWRVSPDWDDNTTFENNEIRLQTSTVANFSTLVEDFVVTTNSTTGAGSTGTVTAALGVNFFRLVYYVGDVQTTVSDTISTFDPYFNNLVYTPTNTAVKELLNFGEGFKAYTDRTHTLVSVPSVLVGGHYLQTRQGDKTNSSLSVSFDADPGTTVFVLIDNRVGDGIGGTLPVPGADNPPVASALPWLANNGFLDSGLDIGIDEDNNGSINNTSSVFFKQVPVGAGAPETTFNLGSLDTSSPTIEARSVYGVVITKPQVVPVSFHAYVDEYDLTILPTPPVTSSTLYWTLPTDATSVSISPTVGSVNINGNGQGNVIVSPTTTTTYTLTASSVSLGPISRTTTVTVISPPPTETPFESWMSTLYPGITTPNNLPGADPDGDGVSNFGEFAFSGNPGSGSDDGITRSAIDNVSGTNHLTLTFACRTGASFSGSGPVVSAAVDGVIYTVRGSLNLSAFTEGLTEVTPAIVTGLPAAPSGYEYRTFRVTAAQSANPKAFIQAVANTPAP